MPSYKAQRAGRDAAAGEVNCALTGPFCQPRMVGADASHAWVSVYSPDSGWLDVDPTNNVQPSDKHLVLGWGRDFEDVSPLKGVILGGEQHSVGVSVDVAAMDEDDSP